MNQIESEQTSRLTTETSHPLHYGWVFWFMHRSPGEKITNYEGAMKKIATFNTVKKRKSSLFVITLIYCLKIFR